MKLMRNSSRRNVIFLSVSQFGSVLSFNFIMILVPFYIARISPYTREESLLWTGAILGIPNLILAVLSPFWGYLTHRFSPKALYIRGVVVHALMFFFMGLTTSLPMLLLLRILQGVFGGVSTIALIIISRSSPPERAPSDLGFFQSAMTLGQLVGPPLGTFAVGILGYSGAFFTSAAMLFASGAFCYRYVADIPRLPKTSKSSILPTLDRRIVTAWMICFVVQLHLMFLPSILPNVFRKLAVAEATALNFAGILVMLYTVTALAGTTLWCWLAKRIGLYRIIVCLGALATLFEISLVLCTGIASFTVVRMIQTGLVAAIVPLTLSIFAGDQRGSVMGFLNSARFVGNSLGPMMATSILAYANLPVLYLLICGISLCAIVPFSFIFRNK
jgi:MFS family permease